MISFNAQLFAFALQSLLRFFSKNLFILIIYTLLVMLLSSLFLIRSSIKVELEKSVNTLPDIVLQNQKAHQFTTMHNENTDKILEIYGVSDVYARVHGKYEFKQADKVFKIIGIDQFEPQKEPLVKQLLQKNELESDSMFVSAPLEHIFSNHYYKKYFNFIKPSLKIKKMKIVNSFEPDVSSQEYVCIMTKDSVREILGYKDDEITDIAIYVSNKNELMNIISKLQQLYPTAKVITKEDEQTKLNLLLDYDSGIFITLFIISIFTFFMIVFDKANGVSSVEKKEIGILKALGWRVEDILRVKIYEGMIISVFSYILGVCLALLYLYFCDGCYLRDIFLNILHVEQLSTLDLKIDFQPLAVVFFLSVPVYIAATLIPSWKIATTDADEVMR